MRQCGNAGMKHLQRGNETLLAVIAMSLSSLST